MFHGNSFPLRSSSEKKTFISRFSNITTSGPSLIVDRSKIYQYIIFSLSDFTRVWLIKRGKKSRRIQSLVEPWLRHGAIYIIIIIIITISVGTYVITITHFLYGDRRNVTRNNKLFETLAPHYILNRSRRLPNIYIYIYWACLNIYLLTLFIMYIGQLRQWRFSPSLTYIRYKVQFILSIKVYVKPS